MKYIKSISCIITFCFISSAQANVQSYFDQIKNDPNTLYAFFKKMPKGGELHYHLAGGAYPEAMLYIASKGNYCLNPETGMISQYTQNCKGLNSKDLFSQPEIYAKTIKNWSMQDFVPGIESGHDHFFNSFFKFLPIVNDHQGELLADVMQTAAQQNEHYMEVMVLPDNGQSLSYGDLLKDSSNLNDMRNLLLANKDFQNSINYTVSEADNMLNKAHQELRCNTNSQQSACQLKVKFLYYSLREQPFNGLFAQTLNAFEAVAQSMKRSGSLVGVNLVQAEDGIIALRDYRKQMQMYRFFHQLYPQVPIALHAGELTQEIVAPKELDFHIHDALFTGKAQRIGHGVDIARERNPEHTLDYMSSHHKAVEINLISNLRILNVSGSNHPLAYYLKHGVPVVLSTDDEGILRTNLSLQYVEAVQGHGLDYQSLKEINRNALTYSFLPGKSIWSDAHKAELVKECRDLNSNQCKQFVKSSEKAQLQQQLEQQLSAFEDTF